jgi:hypothetical protein
MKTLTIFLVAFLTIAVIAMNGCAPSPTPIATPEMPTPTLALPTATAVPPTSVPGGRTIVVTSAADSGPGTLRQALLDVQNGDTVTFDPVVFPPTAPETIAITSALPQMSQGHLTIDASDAGVILDGSQLPTDSWIPGLEIVSDGNTIRGLQIIHFTGTGIVVALHGRNNTIGGDRNSGLGPIGQGNLSSGNDFGIGLWDFASHNIVTGNLVGTDVSGTGDLGNRSSGVWVGEGGMENVIGPDNIIAHNDRCGIEVSGSDSLGNTLTQNSTHDNGGVGICLLGGGNTRLGAPFFVDFDSTGGLVAGTACANCTVEIFSDSGDEGAVYEGQAVADSSGVFTFNKGAAFINTNITSTATDADGNTSEFSWPSEGPYGTMSLQQENNLPLTPLWPKPSQELRDNHVGVHFEDYGRYSNTELVYMNGFKWIRIQSLTEFWSDVDLQGPNDLKTFSLESIPPSVDNVISEYANNGVSVVLDLWMGAGLRPYGTTFQSEEEVDRFSDYVRFVVSHFKDRIHYYEIWNEPGDVAVRDYANLVRHVVPVIREEDPGASIIIGAIHGSWENGYPGYGDYQRFSLAVDYLNELLLSGVAPLVDGISWHPFYDNIPSDPYYQDYPQMLKEIKDLAAAQGFTGEYFADELLWRTVTERDWAGGPPVSPLIAAKYYARAITMHRGLGVNVTINTFFLERALSPIHNLCDTMAGAEPMDIALSLVSEATSIRHYAFSLPNGDRLIALWKNGEAVEDDPGVITNLTLPGISAQEVIGIDVLNGLEQELITDIQDGNLVIRNLLVKDYPVILRVTD